jgi:16S rRNA processing protein RimM
LYLDGCPVGSDVLRSLGPLQWRGRKGESRALALQHVRTANQRLLVTFEGVTTREAAATLVNGFVCAEASRLPDPGPGVSYAYELVGLAVVDAEGRALGRVADVVFNAGQPLLELEAGRLLPCQPPFLKHLDREAGVITLDLPAGFDEF